MELIKKIAIKIAIGSVLNFFITEKGNSSTKRNSKIDLEFG